MPEHNNKLTQIQQEELEFQREIKREEQELQKESIEQERIEKLKDQCKEEEISLRTQYNNINSVYFDNIYEECRVRFYDDNGDVQDIATNE